MRAREIRELTEDEARQKERELTEELFRVRMRKGTGQVDNPMQARLLRRDLARLKTIQHERARAGQAQE
ncbi:MAG: 50S ribosomal protein L29 [Desulfurellaceae bacterium]|nr:50S ribosomal protein L29 [Desulfurellaceae bacterium]